MSDFAPTEHTRLRRLPERGSYDRELVYSILDEALICHVGFVEGDRPVVIPTIHARDGDRLILHGSQASRMLRSLRNGIELCINVTLLDGVVLARSLFHHSMNYRSVVVFGTATEIVDEEEELEAMRLLTERVIPGRWAEARHPNQKELKATRMLQVPLTEASAKVRSGPPGDDEEDLALDIWAGVLPARIQFGTPQPDAHTPPDRPVPDYVTGYTRGEREN